MKAMLLAAGLGTRLKPLTNKIPKPLIPVNGIPLIFYNLALLKKYGIWEVVINLHYRGEQIQSLLGDGSRFGFKLQYSYEKNILGTGGGIKRAERFLKKDPFLVMNADIIIDLSLKRFLQKHHTKHGMATLVVIKSPHADQYGPLFVNRRGQIGAFLKPPRKSGAYQKTIFAGVHLVGREIFASLPANKKTCIIRDSYIPLLQSGRTFFAHVNRGYWNDLGTPSRLKQTERDLKSGRVRLSFDRQLKFLRQVLEKNIHKH